MKRSMTRIGTLGFTLFWVFALAVPGTPSFAQDVAPKVVEAWEKAGARVAWYGPGAFGSRLIFEVKPNDLPSLLVFRLSQFKPGVFAKLPAPSAPFALNLEELTDAGMKELPRFKHLRRLDLSGTKVTDKGLKELAGLENLQELEVGATKVTDAGLKEIGVLKNIQSLSLFETSVTDVGLKELAGLVNLKELSLYKTKVTDAGLKELRGLKNLQGLTLQGTQVTDAGLKELSGLTSLRHLVLADTKLTDAGLEELSQFKSLESLNLVSGTRVTNAAVIKLRKARPQLRIIHPAPAK